MIAKKLTLDNFGAYTHFEIDFPEGTFDIIGLNGSGKSTLIKALLAGIKGISKNQGGLIGERYQFIGDSGKTAKIEWVLRDEFLKFDVVIKNHISKSTNSISFVAPEGSNLDKKWFDGLLSVALMTSKHFCSHSPREQSKLLGIDTGKFDIRIQNLKDEFTLLNRDLTNFGELGSEPEKVKEVKTNELSVELEKLQTKKTDRDMLIWEVERCGDIIKDYKEKIAELEKELMLQKEGLQSTEGTLKKTEVEIDRSVDPSKEMTDVQEKISTAGETNEKYTTWKTWTEDTKKKADAKTLTDNNKKLQKDQTQLKINYMKNFKFPFSDMGVDDSGGLVLKGRHINENGFSGGELELITAKISVMLNPELRIRMIDDAKLLDPENKENIKEQLEKEGFQVIFFLVDDKKSDSNSILLRECKQVDSYKDTDKKML